MKKILTSVLMVLLLGVLDSCTKDKPAPSNNTSNNSNSSNNNNSNNNNNNPVVKPACLPKTSVTRRSDGTVSSELTYEYRDDGQLKSWKMVRPGSQNSTGTYTYDTQGYCTGYTRININGTYNYTYTYANGRLSQIVEKNETNTTTSTETLEYDAQGKLLRAVKVSSSGTSTTSYDANGNVSDYLIKNSSGVESRPYQFENGRLKVATGFTLDYDDKGRVISRTTKNSSGVIVYKETYDYSDTGKNAFPDEQELTHRVAPLKGWPVRVIQFMSFKRLHLALITRVTGTVYKNGVADYMEIEELSVYNLNPTKNIPTHNRKTVRAGGPNIYGTTITDEIYTYDNCN